MPETTADRASLRRCNRFARDLVLAAESRRSDAVDPCSSETAAPRILRLRLP